MNRSARHKPLLVLIYMQCGFLSVIAYVAPRIPEPQNSDVHSAYRFRTVEDYHGIDGRLLTVFPESADYLIPAIPQQHNGYANRRFFTVADIKIPRSGNVGEILWVEQRQHPHDVVTVAYKRTPLYNWFARQTENTLRLHRQVMQIG
ncbi:unnamed protein product [Calicophoron daubneyi]|uniref:Uncharacterized protein n=1 Tax=Calicophoron daubneyi TaxID=300641 RepID=A0AAV2SWA1_CALDB